MEQEQVSHDENVLVVCYDEQHPKKGRCQKYRLTLFDPKTQRPLADELFDDKSSETIKNFLKRNLDTSEPVFIVTDFDTTSPEILKEVFGDKLVPVSYTHLRAHETRHDLVCRLLLEK